jgi:hypothetical protein
LHMLGEDIGVKIGWLHGHADASWANEYLHGL